MKEPLLPEKPIEVTCAGSEGYIVAAYEVRGHIVFYMAASNQNLGHWPDTLMAIAENFHSESPAFAAFITKAEEYFKPLVELPMTVEQLAEIFHYAFISRQDKTMNAIESALASKGFKCKEPA